MKLLSLVAAWVAGLLLGLFIQPSLWIFLPFFLILALVGVVFRFHRKPLAPTLLATLFLLGLIRAGIVEDAPAFIPAEGGEAVRLRGVIDNDPENKGRIVQFVLRGEEMDRGQGWEKASDKILVSARPTRDLVLSREEPFFRYGDRLLLEGRLDKPPVFETFDYRDYLARQGIHLSMAFPQSELLEKGEGNPVLARVYDLRFKMSRALSDSLTEPQASVAQALLLGRRSGLPTDLREDFRNTGTSHLLAISGLHVGVLLVLSLGASAYLLGRRRQYYLLVPLLLIWGYAVLSGLSPSVVRAAIMGSVYLGALGLGRSRIVLPALALAAGIMAGIQPQILREVSFQLSFTAVAGIAVLAPSLTDWARDRFGSNSHGRGWTGSLTHGMVLAVIVSGAATIATLPLVAFNFQQVPTLGIPATVLALPALPFIIGTSLVAVVATFVHPSLGEVLGWIAWVPISYLTWVVQLFALVPESVIAVPKFSGLLVWTYYGVFAVVILAPARFRLLIRRTGAERVQSIGSGLRVTNFKVLAPGLALSIFAAVAWSQALTSHDGRLHVLFLDVDQGDSIFIITPQEQRILVDGGPDPLMATRALDAHLPFWDRSLDLVVATHPDEDHLRGLIEVVKRHKVDTVLEGIPDDSALYLEWRQALDEEALEVKPLYRGQTIDLGGPVRLEVLNPSPEPIQGASSDGNNNSVVLRLTYGAVSFLLTADIEEGTEIALLQERGYLGSTVLKVPHHGSRTSTSPAFLETVSPRVAVIQVGADNPHGHPHQEVVRRLEDAVGQGRLYTTARHGTVELITDGVSLWVKTER